MISVSTPSLATPRARFTIGTISPRDPIAIMTTLCDVRLSTPTSLITTITPNSSVLLDTTPHPTPLTASLKICRHNITRNADTRCTPHLKKQYSRIKPGAYVVYPIILQTSIEQSTSARCSDTPHPPPQARNTAPFKILEKYLSLALRAPASDRRYSAPFEDRVSPSTTGVGRSARHRSAVLAAKARSLRRHSRPTSILVPARTSPEPSEQITAASHDAIPA